MGSCAGPFTHETRHVTEAPPHFNRAPWSHAHSQRPHLLLLLLHACGNLGTHCTRAAPRAAVHADVVQYQQHAWQEINRPGKYWKLPAFNKRTKPELQHYLTSQNHHFDKSHGKNRLVELCSLCYRGLPSYHSCTIPELEGYVRARRLPVQTGRGRKLDVKKAYLVSALEDADDDLSFERFEDLPAELRLRIYGLHFASFKERIVWTGKFQQPTCHELESKPMSIPSLPPLTEVSRLMRQETLPVFYQTMPSFLHAECSASINRIAEGGHEHDWRYWTSISPSHVNMMRQISLNLCVNPWGGWDATPGKLLLKAGSETKPLSYEFVVEGTKSPDSPTETVRDFADWHEKFEPKMRQIVEDAGNGGQHVLSRDLVDAVLSALRSFRP
ncbi:uncharacterized protein CLAFUR5_14057 [Fulvia fulva]|uniref:2EXR domain-containing protein n=1 Tax=Passalora fulva TaxID=5499 RepID=A0A9Q8UW26_PASFU|nr:uncharacterized protein CLAFUR5_14057 [Fulvia fulva]KAK4610813.1 hypothetical protein CLAFUR0_14232 [Fulvia fulva]UJO24581.1 hypothetical protein CLAFUR5_14057 [Fulvia fulva]